MRIPFFSMFMTSPFEGLQEHAEKVKECAWAFQQAIECHLAEKCKTFEEFRQEVIQLETEADVAAHAREIYIQAGRSHAMPPPGVKNLGVELEPQERALIAMWFEQATSQ